MHGISRSRRRTIGAICLTFAMAASAARAHAQEPATTTPASRAGAWMDRHEACVERARKGDIDLLFLGDSITQGWDSYGDIWDRYYRPRNPANFGIGGDRTQHVLWRITHGEVDGISPKVAVLMIGTNNAGDDTADEIAMGIEAIVKTLREKLPSTKVLLLGVFPRSPSPDAKREKLAAVNQRIARLDDGKMVRYLDIGKRFVNDDDSISKSVMPDFLHLSSRGYRIWADAMEPPLWELMDEERVKAEAADAGKPKANP